MKRNVVWKRKKKVEKKEEDKNGSRASFHCLRGYYSRAYPQHLRRQFPYEE